MASPTQDGLRQAHEQNEAILHKLEKEVERATSPPSSASASPLADSRKSPASLASALFNRNKGSKSKKSKSGSSNSSSNSSKASQADLKALENQVRAAQNEEMKLVSSAIGTSADGAALNEDGQDDVLDLADQLLAQLDAKEREAAEANPGAAAATGAVLAQPQPIPPPANPAAGLAVPPHGSRPSRTPSGLSAASSPSSSSKPGFGARLKEAFSPPSSSSSSSAAGAIADAHIGPQKNRHALRKEKKKAEEDRLRAEAQAEVDASRANGTFDPAEHEKAAMDRLLKQYRLEILEMDPDGHCMYSAIADQLNSHRLTKKADYKVTRKAAAEYMRKHIDDFLPYLPAEDEEGGGEGLLSPEGYAKHCDNVEDSSVWGSHTEILALSKYYQVPIYVIQADSPVVKVGESEKNQKGPLTISYHRRAFGLGEHYNSLRPAPQESGYMGLMG